MSFLKYRYLVIFELYNNIKVLLNFRILTTRPETALF